MEKSDKFFLGPSALAAIVAVLQKGLIEGTDVSQDLRDLKFVQIKESEERGPTTYHQLDVSRD